MELIDTSIKDLKIIKSKFFKDERGYFFESFKNSNFEKFFPKIKFIQENESYSKKGVLRGLHFQQNPYSQAKLVRVVKGIVQDVAVDLRQGSETFGKYESVILSDENKYQFFIPKGFAHGFLVLSDYAVLSYKIDNDYSPTHESGIRYDDKNLNIDWKIDKSKLIISEKDLKLYTLTEIKKSLF